MLDITTICWLFGAVELLGLTSAWAARLSEGSLHQTCCQRLFLGCLTLVGGATIVSFGLGPSCWLTSGVTLAVMVLTVICDFGRCSVAVAG